MFSIFSKLSCSPCSPNYSMFSHPEWQDGTTCRAILMMMMMVVIVMLLLLLLMMMVVFVLVVMMCTMLLSARDLCFQQSLLLIEVQDRNVETLKGDGGSLLLLTEECCNLPNQGVICTIIILLILALIAFSSY